MLGIVPSCILDYWFQPPELVLFFLSLDGLYSLFSPVPSTVDALLNNALGLQCPKWYWNKLQAFPLLMYKTHVKAIQNDHGSMFIEYLIVE